MVNSPMIPMISDVLRHHLEKALETFGWRYMVGTKFAKVAGKWVFSQHFRRPILPILFWRSKAHNHANHGKWRGKPSHGTKGCDCRTNVAKPRTELRPKHHTDPCKKRILPCRGTIGSHQLFPWGCYKSTAISGRKKNQWKVVYDFGHL